MTGVLVNDKLKEELIHTHLIEPKRRCLPVTDRLKKLIGVNLQSGKFWSGFINSLLLGAFWIASSSPRSVQIVDFFEDFCADRIRNGDRISNTRKRRLQPQSIYLDMWTRAGLSKPEINKMCAFSDRKRQIKIHIFNRKNQRYADDDWQHLWCSRKLRARMKTLGYTHAHFLPKFQHLFTEKKKLPWRWGADTRFTNLRFILLFYTRQSYAPNPYPQSFI